MISTLLTSMHPSIEKFIDILMAKKFNQRMAEKMIYKINKNYKFDNGDTLLDLCLRNNRFKAASWLVKQNIDITDRNKDNISTVRLAIEKGDIVVIDDIMNYCTFNINQVDQSGRSLLQDAVILGYNDIVKILIHQDIDVNIKDKYNKNVIFDAINYGNEEMIDSVLGVNGIELNNVDVTGKTVLHQKIVLENDNIAVKLLKKGADPTICDKNGYNFLTQTALRGDEGKEVLETAIKYGCDLNAKNPNENTVLVEVISAFAKTPKLEIERRSGLKDVAQDLIEAGSDVNSVNKYGENMIFGLIRKGDLEGCAFMLKNGIDINQPNKAGETPLQVACLKGIRFLDMVLLLLDFGADPTIPNRRGQTVPEVMNDVILHIYKFKYIENKEYIIDLDPEGQYMRILKEIISAKGFDFNYYDSHGDPLFFRPFLYGDTNIIKIYLQNGFNINQKNKHGLNLFYSYVLKSFQEDEDLKEFATKLTFLLVSKSDIRIKNNDGQIAHLKVANLDNCNIKLFRKLVELTKFDYGSVDNMGRTIIHACVMSDNIELFQFVYGVERNIQNIADNYNVLPISYAALLGRKEFVWEFLRRDTIINSGRVIPASIKEKFKPMLSHLDTLSEGVEDAILLRQIEILKEQTIKDFT